jgi:hypothetical protein
MSVPLTNAILLWGVASIKGTAPVARARQAIKQEHFMSDRFLDFARNDKKDFADAFRDRLMAMRQAGRNRTVTKLSLQKERYGESLANVRSTPATR